MFVLFYSYTFPEKKYPAKTDKIYRLHYFRYIFYLHFRYISQGYSYGWVRVKFYSDSIEHYRCYNIHVGNYSIPNIDFSLT